MTRSSRFSSYLGWGGGLAAVAGLGLASLPSLAQVASAANSVSQGNCVQSGQAIQLQLFNPNPGDSIGPGQVILSGTAFDRTATQGSGIGQVLVFLDNRDIGGTLLGQATLGAANPLVGGGTQLSNTGFNVEITLPNTNNGAHSLFVYADSSVSNGEAILQVPINVGPVTSATPTPVVPLKSTCSSPALGSTQPLNGSAPQGSVAAPQAPVAPASVAPSTSTQASAPTVAGSAASIRVQLANPRSGDTIRTGPYTISGYAYDLAAAQGTGIDSVMVFLDNRDLGGQSLGTTLLGTANPFVAAGSPLGNAGFTVTADLPTNVNGNHTLYVYAHSAITGQTAILTVPVTVTNQ